MRALVVGLAALAASCSRDPASHGQAEICRPAAGDAIAISDAWVRPASSAQSATAAYFTICNAGDAPDSLLAIMTPDAATAEIHRTSRDEQGVVSMAPVDKIDLPQGVAVALEPGATHVMLVGLTGAITEHESVELTLTFENSRPLTVQATAIAPGSGDRDGH